MKHVHFKSYALIILLALLGSGCKGKGSESSQEANRAKREKQKKDREKRIDNAFKSPKLQKLFKEADDQLKALLMTEGVEEKMAANIAQGKTARDSRLSLTMTIASSFKKSFFRKKFIAKTKKDFPRASDDLCTRHFVTMNAIEDILIKAYNG